MSTETKVEATAGNMVFSQVDLLRAIRVYSDAGLEVLDDKGRIREIKVASRRDVPVCRRSSPPKASDDFRNWVLRDSKYALSVLTTEESRAAALRILEEKMEEDRTDPMRVFKLPVATVKPQQGVSVNFNENYF